MGLDMYLTAKKYISNYEFRPEEKELNAKIKELLGLSHLADVDSSIHASVNVGYWRKSNQIHSWFVKHCQDGVDDCRDAYVGREALQELVDTINEVLETKNPSKLPPSAGFFFGSTVVDDWYWEDLEYSSSMLKGILDDNALKDFDFYYHSSW